MSVVTNAVPSIDSVLSCSPAYPVERDITQYIPRLDARRFATMPVGQILTVEAAAKVG